MIERYTTKEMGRIWSDENKFSTWLKVEIAVTEVLTDDKIVPKEDLKTIKEKAKFDVKRILEIEEETHHDVIAFLTNLSENIGPSSRFIHLGMTSSDLLDTSLALLCKESGQIILSKLETFHKTLRLLAVKHKDTFQIGRSHGVHAEPITFGLKLALWSEEIKRHIDRFKYALEDIQYGKISGAVGTYQHLDPSVEERACKKLGLKASTVSNQVVQRDHHANFLSALALLGCTIEKISVEIRHLQRTEVLEAEEFFAKGQKGSSAMPHKRNPIITERLTGFARLLRANAMAAMENVALWHERDISHSSVERMIGPDSTVTLDFAIHRMSGVIENLVLYPNNMKKNLNQLRGLHYSQGVLLALTQAGMSREKAYETVQKSAMEVWKNNKDFKSLLINNSDVKKYLSNESIEKLFDISNHTKNVKYIFDRVFKK